MSTLPARAAATAVLCLTLLGLAVAPASAQTLDGTLVAAQPTTPPTGNTTFYDVQCDPEDRSGRFSFTATGTASGSLSGTYVEEGTVVFGSPAEGSRVTSYDSRFTLNATDGTLVTGTRSLDPSGTSFAGCYLGLPEESTASVQTTYEATILTPDGTRATDTGNDDKAVGGETFLNDDTGPAGYFRSGFNSVPRDSDGDGMLDGTDNCPTAPNADQDDLDGDGQGDVCDADVDDDGAANGEDAFPRDPAENADTDEDGVGDNADAFDTDPTETTDSDGDGEGDNGDNCPSDANADQANLDGDEQGDACDADIDGDGAANDADAFPRDASESKDTDGDGIGDNGDRFPNDPNESADADEDGTGDGTDNCPTDANANQADLDGDGKGDVCDGDVDGDGVANEDDNAPRTPNADQADLDQDGIGDVVDRQVMPLNADMCKKGGYTRFYDGDARFKNQGDCVSWVATRT